MTSSEPDPERTPRSTNLNTIRRPVVAITWTPDARRAYSALTTDAATTLPTRAELNALTKRAIFQTLQDAPGKMEALEELEDPTFSLDVSFVSDGEIQVLNSSHRNKNKPTDVLSFSQLEGEWMPFEEEEILLGDLIISIETAVRQAEELKHDLKHEIAFLTAHGVLHLIGYDHDTAPRRRAMFAMQDKIVATLARPLKRQKATPEKSTIKVQAASTS